MYFSFHDILPVVWVCLGVALSAMIFLLTFYRMRTRVRVTAPQPEVPDEALPTVSVVVYEAWRQLGYPGAILRS